jgi:xanthine dehydrogenase accessory factor
VTGSSPWPRCSASAAARHAGSGRPAPSNARAPPSDRSPAVARRGAVYDLCTQALEDGGSVVERCGYSDEDAFAVGLTCGGVIYILVTPVTADAPVRTVLRAALTSAARDEPAALTQVIRGPAELLGRSLLVRPDATHEGTHGDGEYASSPHDRVRGGRLAAALVRVGDSLGYHVTVCEARPVFATRARFPDADDIVVDWPHRYLRGTSTDVRTVLCVLIGDVKFDVPPLCEALRMPLAFVGANGVAPHPRRP